MSNPADTSPLCPACGLAPQVRGCREITGTWECRGGMGAIEASVAATSFASGPWFLEANPDRDELLDLRDRDGFLIGTMSPHGMPADVRRLIAAAPEMAELLRRLNRQLPGHPPKDGCHCTVCDTRALLKRIDGET